MLAPNAVKLGESFLSDFTLTITHPLHSVGQLGSFERSGSVHPDRTGQPPWTSSARESAEPAHRDGREAYLDKLPIHGLVLSSHSSFFKTKLASWTGVSPHDHSLRSARGGSVMLPGDLYSTF